MKILITGYRGFIGSNLINTLHSKHDITVYEWGQPKPQVKGFDWVIHVGAIASTTCHDVEQVMLQNYDFSIHLLEECIQEGVNFQFASSASIYGKGMQFKEYAKPDPKTPYAWSKYLVERYVDQLVNPPIIIQMFRYFNVYGKGEERKTSQASPYYNFTQQALYSRSIKVFEDSDKFFRDFIPVENVVDIHEKFLKIKRSGIFNVGSGKATSFLSIAKEIADKYSAQIQYIEMPEEIKSHYQTYTCADMTKTNECLQSLEII